MAEEKRRDARARVAAEEREAAVRRMISAGPRFGGAAANDRIFVDLSGRYVPAGDPRRDEW